ncbi:GHKL domain-containing protein [Carboxylicivirga mesophila]|uniref:histidine kinase n=1 Tax=Carboxylicivirga mesophila TaxID=1166478 RepID=A0ABS5KDS3_9BACT|nr:HAMP domain-containing sensor histidine kinase [Carboxylicivirga mesophila]MBS2213170.1 GHKL domain-containing protein [Carboxylicivirga mesophila]
MSRQQHKIITLLIVAIALYLLGRIVEHQFDHEYTHDADSYSIQLTIKDKQNELIQSLAGLNDTSKWNEHNRWGTMDSLAKKDQLLYLYEDSTLIAWSTHIVPINKIVTQSASVIQLANGWYLQQRINVGRYELLAISLIKKQYEYQNKFLNNDFADDFTITHNPGISLTQSENTVPIYDINDNYLLSLHYSYHQITSPTSIAAFVLYLLCFSLLIAIGIKALDSFKNRAWSNHFLIGSLVFFVGLWLLFINFAIPKDFSYHPLFSPVVFAFSDWLSSLGSMLMFSLFILIFAYCFYRYYKTPAFLLYKQSRISKYLFITTQFVLLLILFLAADNLLAIIVNNSSQAAVFFNITDLNSIALYKLIIICLLYISVLFIFERIIVAIKSHLSRKEYLIIAGIFIFIALITSLIIQNTLLLIHPLVLFAIGFILLTAQRNNSNGITYSSFIWVIFITSFYLVILLYHYNLDKEKDSRELLIENLSFQLTRESDPIAEMYLSDIEEKLKSDEQLIKLLLDNENNEELINSYLEKNYFYGYWKRYNLEIVVCWESAPLYLESENITTNCYQYFDELITKQGKPLESCDYFYFLDNDNGQITYFGKIPYLQDDPNKETTLYCEINSTPIFSGLGYPELLQNQSEQINNALYKNYSFAKFIDNKLVKQLGPYRYSINNTFPQTESGSKLFFHNENTVHLIYQISEDTVLVLSRPEIKIIYLLMSFSVYALLFFLLTAIIFFITRTHKNSAVNFSIQEKIQITFVSLMVVILLAIGISSVFYSIHQFKQKNNQMLSQRIKSVLQEMEQKIVNEQELDYSMHDYLQYLLQKFSNVFYSDINLYNTNGRLLATSRPEVYQQGLSGQMMNTHAFYQLTNLQKAEYIHEEYIGTLHFTSAYVPIYNYEGNVLAYLNLPYFVGNNELKSEIYSLIVAVINAYLLFVLFAIGVAVFISRRITRPLFLIQDRLAQIRIDKLNQKINYKGNDEIGNLVKEYNRMVDEISESAEKLAKSEREMAWREMAKQIAHEIKNPLTPMKLSVQYLTKAWENNPEDFDSYLERVSKTLIEQIDQLHTIANEFSNFAKMPQAKRTKVDIIEKLINTTALFEKSEPDMHFSLNIEATKRFVFADPDQLVSIFNNVIKNAVQAIPANREGIINITATSAESQITIAISDNGKGISNDVMSKIFMPNFTTKSSGMGLGLAIVKNIVVNSGGEIWFKTTEDIGTTFYIQFPAYEED